MQGVPFPLPCKILRVGFSFLVCILMLGLPLSVAAAHHVRLKQSGLIEDHAGSLRISISPSIARATYLQRHSSCLPSRPPGTSQVLFLLYFMLPLALGHLSICHTHTDFLIKERDRENSFVPLWHGGKCLCQLVTAQLRGLLRNWVALALKHMLSFACPGLSTEAFADGTQHLLVLEPSISSLTSHPWNSNQTNTWFWLFQHGPAPG